MKLLKQIVFENAFNHPSRPSTRGRIRDGVMRASQTPNTRAQASPDQKPWTLQPGRRGEIRRVLQLKIAQVAAFRSEWK